MMQIKLYLDLSEKDKFIRTNASIPFLLFVLEREHNETEWKYGSTKEITYIDQQNKEIKGESKSYKSWTDYRNIKNRIL